MHGYNYKKIINKIFTLSGEKISQRSDLDKINTKETSLKNSKRFTISKSLIKVHFYNKLLD